MVPVMDGGRMALGSLAMELPLVQIFLYNFPFQKKIIDVAAGVGHSLFCSEQGQVYSAGWNGIGQLGDGTTNDKHDFVAVAIPEKMVKVFAGIQSSFALSEQGNLYI